MRECEVMKRSRVLREVHETASAMRRSGSIDEKTMKEFYALTGAPRRRDQLTRIVGRLNSALEAAKASELPRLLIMEVKTMGVDLVAHRLSLTPKEVRSMLARRSRLSYQEVVLLLRGLGLRLSMLRPKVPSGNASAPVHTRRELSARLARRSPVHTKTSAASALRRIRGK